MVWPGASVSGGPIEGGARRSQRREPLGFVSVTSETNCAVQSGRVHGAGHRPAMPSAIGTAAKSEAARRGRQIVLFAEGGLRSARTGLLPRHESTDPAWPWIHAPRRCFRFRRVTCFSGVVPRRTGAADRRPLVYRHLHRLASDAEGTGEPHPVADGFVLRRTKARGPASPRRIGGTSRRCRPRHARSRRPRAGGTPSGALGTRPSSRTSTR